MEHTKEILSNGDFYCSHLGTNLNDEKDIVNFTIADPNGLGLKDYLIYHAFGEEENNYMRTYLVRDNATNELVCFFSLKAGLISLNEMVENEKVSFDTLPGIELANFAVNSSYIRQHPESKGVGLLVYYDFILPIIRKVSEEVGVRIVYIFALPLTSLINRYQDYGFRRLPSKQEEQLHRRIKPSYDENCIFMYQLV